MSVVASWLRQNTTHYAQPDVLHADVLQALDRWQTIRPKTDVYTYDDGRQLLLLCLHGLLPIAYRGASYHIPIAVWLTRDHPREPPIAYVVPTRDMLVRSGAHVDPSGRCTVPYLQNWQRKPEGCSLAGLLDDLREHFSRDPPVYARPKEPADRPSPSTPAPPPTSVPGPSSTPAASADGRPRLPPKPGASIPAISGLLAQSPPPATPSPIPGLANPYKPAPPPPQAAAMMRPELQSSQNSRPPPPPWSAAIAQASSPATHPMSLPQTPAAYGSSAPGTPVGYPLQTYYKPPPPLPTPAPFPALSAAVSAATQNPAVLAPNFLDAEDVPGPSGSTSAPSAPSRPPNPELLALHARVHHRLSTELASLTHALALDAERLRAHQADLLAGPPAIADERGRLCAVRDVCSAVAGRLRSAVDTAEAQVAELQRRGEPSVDELVCATTIVHNQLIELVAEDNALEDTMYHLHRALCAGRIDLDRFLRTSRVLAEEQFMKRALIEKIQAGLIPGGPGVRFLS